MMMLHLDDGQLKRSRIARGKIQRMHVRGDDLRADLEKPLQRFDAVHEIVVCEGVFEVADVLADEGAIALDESAVVFLSSPPTARISTGEGSLSMTGKGAQPRLLRTG